MTEITLERLKKSRLVIAECIKRDGPVYLPLFEKMTNEIAKRERDEDLLEQALSLTSVH